MGGLIRTGAPEPATGTEILLLPGPIHTDLLLPLDAATRERFGFLAASGQPLAGKGARWLIVGWGARGFYTTTGTLRDLRAGRILRAATGDAAVIRVEVAGDLPQDWLESVGATRLRLGPGQYPALLDAVAAAFASHDPLDLPGLTGRDAFFPARGRFTLLRTCNTWVGETLRAAGVRVGLWTPFTWSLP